MTMTARILTTTTVGPVMPVAMAEALRIPLLMAKTSCIVIYKD
jgi:hypothetical protein